jgi:hypothetical protein
MSWRIRCTLVLLAAGIWFAYCNLSCACADPPAAGPEISPAAQADPNQPAPAAADARADAKGDANIVFLSPEHDLWIDKTQHEVVMKGKVTVREGNLEMLACPAGTKDYESIVAVSTKAAPVHAALLALGAKVGHPAHYDSKTQKYSHPTGTEIGVFIRWTDDKGKHESPAQDWVRNIKTHKALEYPWVFGGSIFEDEGNGQKSYAADGGDFICVANFPTAMMDLPIESPKAWDDHLFEPFTDRIPPKGTAVELVLKPKLEKPGDGEKKSGDAPKDAPTEKS